MKKEVYKSESIEEIRTVKDLGCKLLLYTACSYMLWLTGLSPFMITILVVALAVSSLCTYLSNFKAACALIGCYCLLSIWQPPFGLYLPLLLYDACRCNRNYKLPPVLVTGVYIGARLPSFLLLPYIFITVFSALLSILCDRIYFLHEQLHRVEDENKTAALAMKERNRALIEKQDSEIRIATLSERNRIAREIHDNVGHLLTRSILQTGALKTINREAALEEPLSTLHDTLNTAMTSIRTSVHDLHDNSIDLSSTLKDIISHISHPAIQLDYDVEGQIEREIKYAFIAITKEAVTNMQKHSNATAARITVREHPSFYQLQIDDNGSVKGKISDHGIGLSNMTERVEALGGTIRFSTDNGFRISVSIFRKK